MLLLSLSNEVLVQPAESGSAIDRCQMSGMNSSCLLERRETMEVWTWSDRFRVIEDAQSVDLIGEITL